MPEYLSPGVYVEEVEAGPKPIASVSTSTAGAVGVTARGPTDGKPVLVTSFADFTRTFGGLLSPPPANIVNTWLDPAEGGRFWWFPLSVRGFFDNGGQRLYVKRAFASTAVASSAPLGQGLVAHVAADQQANATQLRLDHLFGVDNGTALRIFNGQSGQEIGAGVGFAVTAYDPRTSRVTLNNPVPDALVESRGDFVEIAARSASPVPAANETLIFTAVSRGAWGDALSVRTRPVEEATLNIMADPVAGGAEFSTTIANTAFAGGVLTVTVAAAGGLANGDRILVNGREFAIANLNAGAGTFDINVAQNPNWPAGTLVRRLRAAAAAGANTINVFGANQLYVNALVELDNGTDKEVFTVDAINGTVVTLSAALANGYFEGHRMRAIALEVTVTYAPEGVVEAEEIFRPLRLFDDGTTNFAVRQINARSRLVRARTGAGFSDSSLAVFPTSPTAAPVRLAGGDDRLGDLTIDDFVGVDGGSGLRTGIQALEDIDEVSICMVPNVWSSTVRSALITHCEVLKDRFGIIDPEDGLDIEGIRATREPLDTKYAALYYPWVVVRDPRSRRNVRVAPSGHVAGIYARTDVERGVHKAPANVVIRGIAELGDDVTKREQDMLNPRGINVLRAFPNLGMRVWGARTLSSDTQWRYVNVRRLFLMVEESIDEGTQWVVFEPNDEPLWARVRQSVSNYLTSVWRDGALEGATTEEAFFVTCDRTTMTQDDIDNGRLICLIGIAPVKPAEFVIFRIQHKLRELQPA